MDGFAERRQVRRMVEIFGFDGRLLRDEVVARAAAAGRSYMSGLYPPTAPGMVRWIHSVAACREALAPYDYEPDDTDLIAGATNRDRRIKIVPSSGNRLTGIEYAYTRKFPSTKWPKGERTVAAVSRNNQLALFGQTDEPPAANEDEPATWILLLHADEDEIRAELSQPGGVNARGYIDYWHDRFILPPLENEGGPADDSFGDDDDGGIDIPVEPR